MAVLRVLGYLGETTLFLTAEETMNRKSVSGLRAKLGLTAVAAALAVLSIAPIAEAKPKPKLKGTEYCEVINGFQYYGIAVSGKGFPKNLPINTYVIAITPSGDQIPTEGGLVVANRKGRWSSFFKTGSELESITFGAVSFLTDLPPVEVTVEQPCQDG